LGFILAALLLIGFAPAQGDLTVAIRNIDYDTFDPNVSSFTQAAYVFRNIFDRLIYIDENSNLVPWLATSWEANEDATVWTLSLREGVTFHDGTPFNAEALAFNFERMVAPETQSRTAGPLLGPYERTEIIDEFTVRVHFSDPYALFTFAISSPFMGLVSPTAVAEAGDRFNQVLIGSGPFMFVSENPQVEVVLAQNPDYNWGPTGLHEGPAYLDQLIFKFILEDETRLATLLSGEIDIIDEIPPSQVDRILADPAFEVYGAPKVGVARSVFFNTDKPPVDDVRVRQAILHAIDREAINIAIFKGVYPLASVVLTPGTRFYDETLEDLYPYDPEGAIALLEEAGWTEVNRDGYRVKDGEVLSIAHTTFPGFVAEAPAEIIQAQLRDVGIEMSITVVQGAAYLDGIISPDSIYHSSLIGSYSPDPGLLLNGIFNSAGIGSTNYAHYADAELDALLQEGLQTTDQAARADIYAAAQRIIMENAVVAPIYANVSVFGAQASVVGFKFDPYAQPEFFDVQVE
jgi:peptide/nickel transport system substrate-binding protein